MSMRKFSRVSFQVMAVVSAGGRRFQGSVSNLSMNGVFILTTEKLPLDEQVDITITLEGTDPEISVAFSGRVSRIQEDGLGFRFDKIDLDSYTHLKNIISYNMADPDKVLEEIYSDIEEKLASEK